MIEHPIEGDYRNWVLNAFRQSTLFSALDAASLEKITRFARLLEFEAGEMMLQEGDASDAFFVVLIGEAVVSMRDQASGESIVLDRLRQNDSVGELGMLMQTPRTASVRATKQTYAVRFDVAGFDYLIDRLPIFARRLSAQLAERLTAANQRQGFAELSAEEAAAADPSLIPMFSSTLLQDYHAVPIRREGADVVVGFVDGPTVEGVAQVRRALGDYSLRAMKLRLRDYDILAERFGFAPEPIMEAQPVGPSFAVHRDENSRNVQKVTVDTGRAVQRRQRGVATGSQVTVVTRPEDLARIEPLLRRMIQTGASDLHLSAMQRPRWRVDGEIYEISDAEILGQEDVLNLMGGLIPDTAWSDFEQHYDCDFAFAVDGLARFRVNAFRDENGVSAALRLVPMHIPTMEQLGLPKGARTFTELNQGLVLVCGPTGSGKSTTLAAMLDHINTTRRSHIVTIEDPIEFQHQSKVSMVTQREVGKNTSSFHRGLRASLREDPDIILVGELRDAQTMSLALETAMTGHLVLSTMHTSTAIGTVDRVVEMFPHEQHAQVRSTMADVLRGVLNQQLLKRIGGGRIAAFECLVGTSAVSNCIRQGKNHQIATVMTTNKKEGHRMLNQDLQELVHSNAVDPSDALSRSADRKDLRARLGMPTD